MLGRVHRLMCCTSNLNSGYSTCLSISIRKLDNEHAHVPGMLECDTVVHRGPTLQGEFVRTSTMADISTGWTECIG
jgi:hypothetical protein